MIYSYTFLNTYKKCHRRAKLQYIDKVVDASKIDHRSFIVGTVVDWLFSKWIKEQEFLVDWMEMKADPIFRWFAARRHIVYRGDDDKEKLIKRTVKVAKLLQEAAFELELPNEHIETQKILKYKGEPDFEDWDFFAKTDLWFPDKKAIWDLKVTTQSKYLDPFQLMLYAWVFEKNGFTVKELAFLVPELAKPYRPVEFDESVKADFELELIELLLELKKEEEWDATAKDCWGCPVIHHCEAKDLSGLVAEKKEDGGFSVFVGEDIFK